MDTIGSFALFIAAGAIGVSMLLGPIGQAIARRIGGKRSGDGLSTGEMTAERVALLEQRLAETEAGLIEAQERLDFAERLLGRGTSEPAGEAHA
ncbi:MAG TPA: hypothetical protein VFN96_06965 [Gemmatimonadales bacterium]|nr:hypothetical protein [Gemmatimonadales bacterium]